MTSLFGLSVLDLTPTVLTLYGLPTGADMDGHVIVDAFENPPETRTIPVGKIVPGDRMAAIRPHTRLDPVASAEAMEQLAALGYIERPGPNIEEYVESTVRELRYNLVEALQDADLHGEALEAARDLCRRDPDEQRYALKRFLSCQALNLATEMREIVDDMAGRRRRAFEEAGDRMKSFRETARGRYEEKKVAAGDADAEACAKELAYELNPKAEPPDPRVSSDPDEQDRTNRHGASAPLCSGNDGSARSADLVAEKRWFEALDALKRVGSAQTIRPGILLQTRGSIAPPRPPQGKRNSVSAGARRGYG